MKKVLIYAGMFATAVVIGTVLGNAAAGAYSDDDRGSEEY